jgi:hypothetical protein
MKLHPRPTRSVLKRRSPSGRGAHVREALAHVLRAHGADSTHHVVPVTQRGRDANSEISDPRIIEHLRTVVADLAHRASTSRAA